MAASAATRPYFVGAAVILALIAVTNERRSASFVGSQELMASSAFPGRMFRRFARHWLSDRLGSFPADKPHACALRVTA